MTSVAMRPGVMYGAQFALMASFGRFSGLYLAEFGLSDSQIGMVLTFARLLSLVTQMYCGVLADRLHHGTRRVLLWTNIASSACMALFPLGYYVPQSWRFIFALVVFSVSSALKAPAVSLLDAYTLKYLDQVGSADVTTSLESDVTDNLESRNNGSITGKTQKDSEEEKSDRKSMYGRERLWGAVSWGLTSVLLGMLLDIMDFSASYVLLFISTSISTYLNANQSFWLDVGSIEKPLSAVHGAVELVPVSPLQSPLCDEENENSTEDDLHVLRCGTVSGKQSTETANRAMDIQSDVVLEKEDKKEVKIGVLAAIRVLMTNWRTVFFLYTVMAMGAAMTLVEALLFLFFRQELDSSYTLCGISVLITVAFEIPLFYGQKKLTQWFGFTTLTLIGMMSYIVRVGVYTLLDSSSAWLVMTVEPLHGVTYSLIQLTQVRRMSELVPDHLQSTGQGFMTGCRSVGALTATLIGTIVMEQYGSVPMYQGAMALAATAMVAFVLATPPKEKNNIENERGNYEPVEVEM